MKPLAFSLLALLTASPASAGGFQNLDQLEARLTAALGANVGEAGGPAAPLDRRLKLAACPQTVAIEPPVLGAVALRCTAFNWRIRVPLMRFGGAGPAGPASPGIKAEPVVRRGDPIDLIAETPGFSVSVNGIAQEDGAPGGRIRVRTAGGPNQIIFAEVIGAGRARLPGFN